MKPSDNVERARDMLKAHASHREGWVEDFYHPDCAWTELPINGVTEGRSGGLQDLQAASDLAEKTFQSLSIEPTSIIGEGDRVAIELEFEGTAHAREGSDRPPRVSRLRMAIFLTFKEDQIIRQVDYLIPTP